MPSVAGIGSSRSAAVSSPMAAPMAATSSKGTCTGPGRWPERVAVLRVAGGERQPGVAVVAARADDEPLRPVHAARDLDGHVDRLAAAHPEHHAGQPTAGGGGQPLGEPARQPETRWWLPMSRVSRARRTASITRGCAVSEVEHTAVAVAVEQAPLAEGVVEAGAARALP